MPELVINGAAERFRDDDFPPTLQALLDRKGLDARVVAAEVDGEPVRRRDFSTRALAPGARVELVRFVGGG